MRAATVAGGRRLHTGLAQGEDLARLGAMARGAAQHSGRWARRGERYLARASNPQRPTVGHPALTCGPATATGGGEAAARDAAALRMLLEETEQMGARGAVAACRVREKAEAGGTTTDGSRLCRDYCTPNSSIRDYCTPSVLMLELLNYLSPEVYDDEPSPPPTSPKRAHGYLSA